MWLEKFEFSCLSGYSQTGKFKLKKRTCGTRGTQNLITQLVTMNFYILIFSVNMTMGLFVNFSVVGRDATVGFSFLASYVAWIDPDMNHTGLSIDKKYSENHKIFALLYTDHTSSLIDYSKLEFFFSGNSGNSPSQSWKLLHHLTSSSSHKLMAGRDVFIFIVTLDVFILDVFIITLDVFIWTYLLCWMYSFLLLHFSFSNPFTSELLLTCVQPYTHFCSILGHWQWRRDFWNQVLRFVCLYFCPFSCPPGPGTVDGTLGEWMNAWLRIETPQSHYNCYLPACSFSNQNQLPLLHSPSRPYFHSGFFPELSWNYGKGTHSAYRQVSKHFKIEVNAVLFAWTFQALI